VMVTIQICILETFSWFYSVFAVIFHDSAAKHTTISPFQNVLFLSDKFSVPFDSTRGVKYRPSINLKINSSAT
jgi:hypothetical protein